MEENYICKYCGKSFSKKWGRTNHEKYCKQNPNHIIMVGHSHTEKEKEKISMAMKKAHAEGRAGTWPGRNKIEPSYPEKWTMKMLKNEFNMEEGKSYIKELPFHGFFLDFAWPKSKICIEIDGEQHHRLKEQQARDQKKDFLLKEEGWTEVRADWQWIFNNSEEFIKLLKNGFENYDFKKINEESKNFIKEKELRKEKIKSEKKQNKINKEKEFLKNKKEAIKNGKIDSKGNINKSMLSKEEIERRKKLILNCGVDLQKFGWITKVIKSTGLTKKQIYRIIDKENIKCFKEAK